MRLERITIEISGGRKLYLYTEAAKPGEQVDETPPEPEPTSEPEPPEER